MLGESLALPLWGLSLLLLVYHAGDLLITRKELRKLPDFPLVGCPSRLTPRYILNLIFAFNGLEVLGQGYIKFKGRAFKFSRGNADVVVLPLSTLEELSGLPATIASPHGALEHDLLGPYTGLDVILENRMHHVIVQRRLTPRLGTLLPDLQLEFEDAFEKYFPRVGDTWTRFQPFKVLGKIIAQLSARALVGTAFCRDPVWLDISVNYTENLFKTIVVLRMFPPWMHPFISRLLPSWWSGFGYLRKAKMLLGPKIQELIDLSDAGKWSPGDDPADFNVLSWLVEAAKGKDRNPGALAHVEVLLALASVHTTLLRVVNVLYDLTSNPIYLQELSAELDAIGGHGWSYSSYNDLKALDSFIRESQRLSPPTITGLKRLFKEPYTFSSPGSEGLQIPRGTYVCLPTMTIENDPAHTPDPASFDGLRSYRLRQTHGQEDGHQFSQVEPSNLGFGYGKSACPGRFFASLIVKMTMVKLLRNYDFKFVPGQGRPKNYIIHEFLFPWPWDQMLLKNKSPIVLSS